MHLKQAVTRYGLVICLLLQVAAAGYVCFALDAVHGGPDRWWRFLAWLGGAATTRALYGIGVLLGVSLLSMRFNAVSVGVGPVLGWWTTRQGTPIALRLLPLGVRIGRLSNRIDRYRSDSVLSVASGCVLVPLGLLALPFLRDPYDVAFAVGMAAGAFDRRFPWKFHLPWRLFEEQQRASAASDAVKPVARGRNPEAFHLAHIHHAYLRGDIDCVRHHVAASAFTTSDRSREPELALCELQGRFGEALALVRSRPIADHLPRTHRIGALLSRAAVALRAAEADQLTAGSAIASAHNDLTLVRKLAPSRDLGAIGSLHNALVGRYPQAVRMAQRQLRKPCWRLERVSLLCTLALGLAGQGDAGGALAALAKARALLPEATTYRLPYTMSRVHSLLYLDASVDSEMPVLDGSRPVAEP